MGRLTFLKAHLNSAGLPLPDISDTAKEIQDAIKINTLPAHALDELLDKHEKKWQIYRARGLFSPKEIFEITQELESMVKYWNSQINKEFDPADNAMLNMAYTESVLKTWKTSKKILSVADGLESEVRNDIIRAYAKSKLVKGDL